MSDISTDEIEILAIRGAYDELKCLDPEGRERAMEWLRARFEDERIKGHIAREATARERIARRAYQRLAANALWTLTT